jgi:hypothetical protein
MFGLFNTKKRKYARIAEKARELAEHHVREAKLEHERNRSIGGFKERSRADRRSGTERRCRRVPINFPDRRRLRDRRLANDRRVPLSVHGEENFEGRLRARGFNRERERLIELEEQNRVMRVDDLEGE